MSEAHTPYAGTSGWSGSATSEERALNEDASGVTAARQRAVVEKLRWAGQGGLTVVEVRELLNLHHGQASSALSVLHKVGAIARLTIRRDRCLIYVLPEHVAGRDTAEHGRKQREDREHIYKAFEAGFRLGWEDTTDFPDASVRILFDNWYETEWQK